MKNKLYTYWDSDGKWHLIENGKPATEKQQRYLEYLGWGRDNLTIKGASIVIQSILEA